MDKTSASANGVDAKVRAGDRFALGAGSGEVSVSITPEARCDGGGCNAREGTRSDAVGVERDAARTQGEKLSELELAVLRTEREWWKVARTREEAIRKVTGLSVDRYYLILSAMLERREVWDEDPVLVDRLLRMRDRRLK